MDFRERQSARALVQRSIKRWCVAAACATAVSLALTQAQPVTPSPKDSTESLFQAVRSAEVGTVSNLLTAGVDVNCRDANLATPLVYLLRSADAPLSDRQLDCLRVLLHKGADRNAQDDDKRTALIYAARLGDLRTVTELVEADTYVKTRDRFHKTAVMYAVLGHHRDIVAYLAQNGDLQSPSPADRRKAKAQAQKDASAK